MVVFGNVKPTTIIVCVTMALLFIATVIVFFVCFVRAKASKRETAVFASITALMTVITVFINSIGLSRLSKEYSYKTTLYSCQPENRESFIVKESNSYYFMKTLNENNEFEDFKLPKDNCVIYHSGVTFAQVTVDKQAWQTPVVEIILPHNTIFI